MARSLGWILLSAILLSSCAPGFTVATLTPAPRLASPTGIRVPASTPTQPAPTATATISATPQVNIIARDLPGPDDLTLAPDGSIWVSDVVAGTVSRLAPDGSLEIILRGLLSPEGLVFLPDGGLVIAEQGQNRLVRYDPAAGVTPWLDLPNHTSHPGVDGIAFDAQSDVPAVIVPDSPNGNVLRVAISDRKPQVIVSGFTRPVGAWVTQDGSIWVVDETDPGPVVRIRPDGSREEIARMPTPDDIVVDASGNVFVTTLGDRSVHWIDSSTGQDRILVQGLAQPQGLAFDAMGNLLVADTGLRQILRIVLRGSVASG